MANDIQVAQHQLAVIQGKLSQYTDPTATTAQFKEQVQELIGIVDTFSVENACKGMLDVRVIINSEVEAVPDAVEREWSIFTDAVGRLTQQREERIEEVWPLSISKTE